MSHAREDVLVQDEQEHLIVTLAKSRSHSKATRATALGAQNGWFTYLKKGLNSKNHNNYEIISPLDSFQFQLTKHTPKFPHTILIVNVHTFT